MTKLLASFVISAIYVSVVQAEKPRTLENRTIALPGLEGGILEIIDGKPKLLSAESSDWRLRETDKGWTIQKGNQYLAVDKEGKVKLVAEPGEGVYWKLNVDRVERWTDVGAEIQASGGRFDGWYLGFSDKAQQFKYSQTRRTYKMYDPELSEKSGARTKVRIFIDGP
jgi:hypothetical protein